MFRYKVAMHDAQSDVVLLRLCIVNAFYETMCTGVYSIPSAALLYTIHYCAAACTMTHDGSSLHTMDLLCTGAAIAKAWSPNGAKWQNP